MNWKFMTIHISQFASCVLLLFEIFLGSLMAQDRNRVTWQQWSNAMEELHKLSLWNAPPFESESTDVAVRRIASLETPIASRLSALGVLRPVLKEDGTGAFEAIRRLVTNVSLDEAYRYQLVTSLSMDRNAESLVAVLVKDPRFGDGKFKAGYIMRLLDIRLVSQSPPGEDALVAVRSVLNDDRPIVRAAAVRYLGSEDPASESILIAELQKQESCTLPARMLLELADPAKDHVAELMLPFLNAGEKDVRIVAATHVAINKISHAPLWKLALNPKVESDLASSIIGELANHQTRDEFLSSALTCVGDRRIPTEVRLKAVTEVGSLMTRIGIDQNLFQEKRKQFENLLRELMDSEATSEKLKDGIQQLELLPASKESTSVDIGARRVEFERLRSVVMDARASLKDRHTALLDLRKRHPQFFEVALDIAKNDACDPELRATAIRAIASGLKDGNLKSQEKTTLRRLLLESKEAKMTDSLKKAFESLDKLRELNRTDEK